MATKKELEELVGRYRDMITNSSRCLNTCPAYCKKCPVLQGSADDCIEAIEDAWKAEAKNGE